MAESRWWEGLPVEAVAWWQLNERLLCMDFSDYHRIMEEALGRPVWTHEFADLESLKRELLGETSMASFADVLNKIPKDKSVIILEEK